MLRGELRGELVERLRWSLCAGAGWPGSLVLLGAFATDKAFEVHDIDAAIGDQSANLDVGVAHVVLEE